VFMSTAGTIDLIGIAVIAVVLNVCAVYCIYGLLRNRGMRR